LVVAAAIDGQTGEVRRPKMTPDHGEIAAWTSSLVGRVQVVYEAGPTGFGLARFLLASGVECGVAAPSKLQRRAGDRVKTDAREAHLLRLLHLGEITAVTVPSVGQEAPRDLVRAREDVRGDLMSARHRVSKLLLRQGSSTMAARRGTVCTMRGCRQLRFELAGLQTAYETMLAAGTGSTRRLRRWPPTPSFTPVVDRLGCLRGVSTLTGFGLAVEIGDWQRLSGRSVGAYLGMTPNRAFLGAVPQTGRLDQGRQQPRLPAADRGRLAPPRPIPGTQG